jgi:hypothetical protein
LIFERFPKICRDNLSLIKIVKAQRVLCIKANIHFFILRSIPLRIRSVSHKRYRDNDHAHFIFSNLFFENGAVSEIMWKNRAGKSTDNTMGHAHVTLATYGHKYTLRLCNIYCFSTATMVACTRQTVTLRIHCLSCF